MQLRSLFTTRSRGGSAEATTLGVDRPAVVAEYMRIVEDQLARLGVPERAVRRQVRYEGLQTDRRAGFGVYLSLEEWDRASGPLLMLAQGFLEAAIRKAAEASWVSEVTILRGVWLRATAAAKAPEAAQLLRELIDLAGDPGRGRARVDAVEVDSLSGLLRR